MKKTSAEKVQEFPCIQLPSIGRRKRCGCRDGWSPDFKPEEDLPIATVWALLPGLPFHLHNWFYLKQIVAVAGTPLELDTVTKNMNRPSMAKVRIEIDFLKPLITNVWIGNEDEDSLLKGFSQKIEYESIPKYCNHCRKLGHNMENCIVLEKKKMEEIQETSIKKNKKGNDNNESSSKKKQQDSKEKIMAGKETNIETINSFAELTDEIHVESFDDDGDGHEQSKNENIKKRKADQNRESNDEWADVSSSEDSKSEDSSNDQAENLIQSVVGSSAQKQSNNTSKPAGRKEIQTKKDQRNKTRPSSREAPITRGQKLNSKKPSNKSSDD
ncbi:uncharacterized protein LOC132599789 [Lycium barbarum]|uniref:uncharacterized protein LOC132599789 n=1 Tax=Lycium barbarum TaxID=112863 RepID=UPI00293E7BF1|nr:uncharacterized protein LOC132599789 [Lycium barbarum]